MTAKATVISAAATGTSGKTTGGTIEDVDGKKVSTIRAMRVTVQVTTALVGSSPTCNLYLQRPIVEDYAAGTEADWDDFFAFTQLTASHTAGTRRYVDIPLPSSQDVDGSLGNRDLTPAQEGLAARTLLSGHWGDAIRVRASLGGTVTTALVYDVDMIELPIP